MKWAEDEKAEDEEEENEEKWLKENAEVNEDK